MQPDVARVTKDHCTDLEGMLEMLETYFPEEVVGSP